MWQRNDRVRAAALVAMGVFLAAPVPAEGPLRVVVHVNFADASQQGRGLKNVGAILAAAASDGFAPEVEVVCHAEGINLVEKARSAHPEAVAALARKGVRFVACENTMRQRSIRKDDLLPAVGTVPSGAYEVVRRQQTGYSYFKP